MEMTILQSRDGPEQHPITRRTRTTPNHVTRIGQKVSPQEKKDHRAKTRTDAPCHVHVMFVSCSCHVHFISCSVQLLFVCWSFALVEIWKSRMKSFLTLDTKKIQLAKTKKKTPINK